MRQLPDELKRLQQALEDREICSNSHFGKLPAEDPEISISAAQLLREEKLKSIQQAVDAGAYDDNSILEKAMERMLQRLQDQRNGQ